MTDDCTGGRPTEIAAAIRAKEVSSREVLDHLVARIERLDGPVNAVVQLGPRPRPRRGRAADDAWHGDGGDDLGPLHGVPMTIKDSFQTEGCTTTSGAPELADHVPDRRRLAGGPAARRRRRRVRQDEPADLRRRHPELQRRLRHHQQPPRRHPHAGRIERWVGGGARDGVHPDRARQRHRRLDPGARPLLGRDGPQAELRHRARPTARSPGRPARCRRPTSPWPGRWRARSTIS
jgi:hypothetical protein